MRQKLNHKNLKVKK